MRQKERERSILLLVYKEEEFVEITDSERPDFILKRKEYPGFFGVEITEFYFSESIARLRNIPNYVQKIIVDNQHQHKDDKEDLKIHNIELFASDGTPKGTQKVIIQEARSVDEYATKIAKLILNKDVIIDEYTHKLSHTNLIIFDANRSRTFDTLEEFHRNFFKPHIKNALYSTRFHEIFLITQINTDKYIYVPLKFALLLSSFFLFGKVITEYPFETRKDIEGSNLDKETDINREALLLLFAKYLKAKTDNICYRKTKEVTEVIWDSNCISVGETRIEMRDYDNSLLEQAEPVESDEWTNFFSSNEFISKEKDILGSLVLVSEIGFDVERKVNF